MQTKKIFLPWCLICILLAAASPACKALAEGKGQVVIYTAVDQIFSEPVLKNFERKTGIRVKAVYDIEAVKTTGLVNRLLAEKANPCCDVFWNNEVVKTIVLKRKGVLKRYLSSMAGRIPEPFKDRDGFWTGFAARARVLIVNGRQMKNFPRPLGLMDLLDPGLRGKVAIANPLFGTTATHVAALFAGWGPEQASRFLMDLKANQVRIVDGNSVVRDMVASGAVLAGLTDTDDASVGLKAGLPLEMILPDQQGMGTLVLPNTVSVVAGCPHPVQARALVDYLLSREVEQALADCPSAQMPLADDVSVEPGALSLDRIKAMDVDYGRVADQVKPAADFVRKYFLR